MLCRHIHPSTMANMQTGVRIKGRIVVLSSFSREKWKESAGLQRDMQHSERLVIPVVALVKHESNMQTS